MVDSALSGFSLLQTLQQVFKMLPFLFVFEPLLDRLALIVSARFFQSLFDLVNLLLSPDIVDTIIYVLKLKYLNHNSSTKKNIVYICKNV